jgi:UDP-N-acetyl-D-mannosaminuronate dehydrogenase
VLWRLVELAGEINVSMPAHVVNKLAHSLDQRAGRGLRDAKILIIGIAYKRNIDDIRGSPAFKRSSSARSAVLPSISMIRMSAASRALETSRAFQGAGASNGI